MQNYTPHVINDCNWLARVRVPTSLLACCMDSVVTYNAAHRSQLGCWGGSHVDPEDAPKGAGGQVLGLLSPWGLAQPELKPCC